MQNGQLLCIQKSILLLMLATGLSCFYNPGTNRLPDSLAGVAATMLGGSGLNSAGCCNVAEGGATDSYSIEIDSEPLNDVIFQVTPDPQVTVNGSGSPVTLTFTAGNWSAPQSVFIAAVDDSLYEGPHQGVIQNTVIAGDPEYTSQTFPDVVTNITDNDVVGVALSPGTIAVMEGGASVGYQARLSSKPRGPVTLNVAFDNVQLMLNNSNITPLQLVFDDTNWDVAQSIDVSAPDDSIVELYQS